MKTSRTLTFLALAVGLFFASGALALEQQRGGIQIDDGATYGDLNLHSGEGLIGTQVQGVDGQGLGRITDIMVNFREGSVGYAEVTATDGQTYLVPVAAFNTTPEGRYVTLDAHRLATAPRFPQDVSVEEFHRNMHEHYGVAYPWGDLPGDVPMRQEDTAAPGLTYPGHREVIPPSQAR